MEVQRNKMLAQYENVFAVHDFSLNSKPINGKRYVFIGGEVIKGTLQKGDVIIVGNEQYTVVIVKKQLDVLAMAKPGEYVYFGVEYAINRVILPFKKEAIQIVKNQPHIESTPQRPSIQTDAEKASSSQFGACDMCGELPGYLIEVDGSRFCSYCYIKILKKINKFLFTAGSGSAPYHGTKDYYFLQHDGRILKVTQEIITYPSSECDFIADQEYISFDEFHLALKSVSQDIYEKYKCLTERTWKEFL